MMRRGSCIGSFLLLFALGCAEESSEPVVTPIGLVAQQCATVISCGCPFGITDVEQCVDGASYSVEQLATMAEAAGLEYDADCAARQVEFFDELGCTLLDDTLQQDPELAGEYSCALSCQLYHGYVGPGEECVSLDSRASNCAAGLQCNNGICQDTCNNWRLAEGATCYDPVNPVTGICVTGTHCDLDETQRCIPTPQAGELCPDNICREGDFCNAFGAAGPTCESIKEVGQPCLESNACSTGYCINSLCAQYPNIGESCSGECRDDLYCNGGVCTVKQSFGQSCDGFTLPCASGLYCNGNVCQQGQPLVCGGGLF
jgi:hypothetical protein